MDRIRIDGLRVATIIGVRDWERQVRQLITIDLEIGMDAACAAARDDLDDAVDYGAVSRSVTALVEKTEARLVETLAETIAAHVLSTYRVGSVAVCIHKPGAVPNASETTLTILREAN